MKYLPLLWSSLWRKKVRTVFTVLSVFVAFLLFGLLMTIRTAFSFGIDMAGLDRLILIHKVSLIMPLPVSYLERLRATEGVTLASHQTWFGGVYQDPANFFAQMAVEPEPFLQLYPEIRVPAEQLAAWKNDRQGALVGLMGTLGSMCWFTAFAIQVAAYVRTLGLIELIFTFLMGRFVFKERASRYELLGVAALVVGIVLVLNAR